MYVQVHAIFYFLYYSHKVTQRAICTRYVMHNTLQWLPKCSHVIFEPIRKIIRWLYTGPLSALQATKYVKC